MFNDLLYLYLFTMQFIYVSMTDIKTILIHMYYYIALSYVYHDYLKV